MEKILNKHLFFIQGIWAYSNRYKRCFALLEKMLYLQPDFSLLAFANFFTDRSGIFFFVLSAESSPSIQFFEIKLGQRTPLTPERSNPRSSPRHHSQTQFSIHIVHNNVLYLKMWKIPIKYWYISSSFTQKKNVVCYFSKIFS